MPRISLDDEGRLRDLVDRLGHDLDPSILIGGWTESQLGNKLRLRVEVLAEHTGPGSHKGWKLLTIEAHTITKMAAILDRPDSEKGIKDADELLRLLKRGVDAGAAFAILAAATAGALDELPGYVETAFRFIAEKSAANKADRRSLDRLCREWVDAAQVAVNPVLVRRERPPLI